MKANHQQLYMTLFVVALLGLLFSTIMHADTIFVTCPGGLFGSNNGKIMSFDSTGNGVVFASGLVGPSGIAFDSSGNLYAANSFTETIDKFDSSGSRTVFASGNGLTLSGVWNPKGITFDNNGNLYVANLIVGLTINGIPSENEGWIEKFSSNGTDLGVFASGLNYPKGLAFDSGGNLYTADNGSIKKFDSSGNGTVFASGLVDTIGLAFDNSGNLYVADYGCGTIVKFDPSGNEMVFASGLNAPKGLAFDSGGNLYAADYGNGTITKFDPSGNGTVFASGLNCPYFITVQVPEPATIALFGLGVFLLRKR